MTSSRRGSLALHAVLGALAYLPLVLTKPGVVAADTRQTMYLNPGQFLSRAVHLWDPAVHLGTVTHQNIGLLFPMGTWFFAADTIGLPVWLAQRLWLGSILFAAGAGVLFLARTLRWTDRFGLGPGIAALLYTLTPYTLQYAPRTSVLLLPYACLPWLIALAARALRTGGWRHPAAFALVALVAGGVNATAILLVGIGPALWFPFAVWVTREATWRKALAAMGRIGLLTAGTAVWWAVALAVQGRYGLPVLAYTETIDQVATTSTAPEVLRGLGYWLFYGQETFQPNIAASVSYLQNPALLVVSFLLPGLAVVGALMTRWRVRIYCIALVVVGTVIGVGVYPSADASPIARLYKAFAADSTAGLALRSSSRAVPLVVLGLALLTGAALSALISRVRLAGLLAGGMVAVLALVNLPALVTGDRVDRNYDRGAVPAYWKQAAAALDAEPHDTRVLEVPGIQFAAYRWGTTYEPITPGLMDRAVVAREQLPYGSPPSADLLIALDRRMQEGIFEPQALAPIARLLSAGDVLLRSDLAYERYFAPRPRVLWDALVPAPAGLGPPTGYGPPVENKPAATNPLLDEQALGNTSTSADPPPVAVFAVDQARPLVRAESADRVMVVDGDGEGLVDAAAAGLLGGDPAVEYAATLSGQPQALAAALQQGADLVVTDSNRKRARIWRSTRSNTGYTETASEPAPRGDLGEASLDLFPHTGDDTRTVADEVGATVTASTYGGPITLDPFARPSLALDGDPRTAWQVGPLVSGVGATLTITADQPVTTGQLTLLQRQNPIDTHRIAAVELRFDGGSPITIGLGPDSLTEPGQLLSFPARTFRALSITVTRAEDTPDAAARGESPLGLAEVSVPGLSFDERIRVPTDLLATAGESSMANRLAFVFTRLRSNPAEPVREDEERSLVREFTLPQARTFSLAGTARLSAYVPDELIDQLVGAPSAAAGDVTAGSSGRLPGDLFDRARAALDGDPTTHWEPAFLQLVGASISATLPSARTIDHLDLQLVADGRHSVPTRVRVTSDADPTGREVDVPSVTDQAQPDGTVAAPVSFPAISGTRFTVTVTAVREEPSLDFFSRSPIPLPIAIAELGLPGVTAANPPAQMPDACRSDLLSIDGQPIPVRLNGTTATALTREGLDLTTCDGRPLTLGQGQHVLRSALGVDAGVDIDRVFLGSERGGGPWPLGGGITPAVVTADGRAGLPPVQVRHSEATSVQVQVAASETPFWLVLGESHNDGWRASVKGGPSLGKPALVDGYANGWLLPAGPARTITMTWVPQREVNLGLWFTALVALACVVLVWRGRRWAVAGATDATDAAHEDQPALDVPLGREGAPSTRLQVVLTVAAAVVTGLIATPAAGVLAGVVVGVAVVVPRGRLVLAVSTMVALATSFLWVIVTQIAHPRRADYEWTKGMGTPHRLALTGIVLLAVYGVLALLPRHGPSGAPSRLSGASTVIPDGRRDGEAEGRDGAQAPRPPDPVVRARFSRASILGAVLGGVLFAWMVTGGTFQFLRWQRVGDFYDAQAHALAEGHWDMPQSVLGIEAFTVHGKSYMYQGPVPALMRVPIAAVTHRFDGRLTALSMLAAYAVTMVFVIRLHWRIRRLARGDRPFGRREQWAVLGFTAVLGGGSSLLFIASRAWVYHEAIMWGVAFSVAAYDAVVGFTVRPNRRDLLLAGLFAALAFSSRASIGAGPVVALGLVLGGQLVRLIAPRVPGAAGRLLAKLRWVGAREPDRRVSYLPGLAAAMTIPVALYAWVNYIKFGTLFSVPFRAQNFSVVDRGRQQMLDLNHGTLFGLKFLPTNLLQMVRPDAIGFTRLFPWLGFPTKPVNVIGNVRFDLIDRTSSVPASLPALTALGVAGVIVMFRRRRSSGAGLDVLRVPVIAAGVGTVVTLTIGYLANRYLGDFFPIMAIASLAGLHLLLSRYDIGRPRRSVRLGAIAVVALSIFTVWANLSLALWFQRVWSPFYRADVIEDFVGFQQRIDDALGGGRPAQLAQGDELPTTAPQGSLFIVGPCDGLYISDGMAVNDVKRTPWNPIERDNAAGHYRLTVTFPDGIAPGTRQPLLTSEDPAGPNQLTVEYLGGRQIRFRYDTAGAFSQIGPIQTITHGKRYALDIAADRHERLLTLYLNDVMVLVTFYEHQGPPGTLAHNDLGGDVTPAFTGELFSEPPSMRVCLDLARRAGLHF